MVIPRYLCTFTHVMVIFQSSHILHQCQQELLKQRQGQHVIFQVIDMPEYSALFLVNNLVHDTPVVFISLISHFF